MSDQEYKKDEISNCCPVCDGGGKLFVSTVVNFGFSMKQAECECWACRGTGKVKSKLPVTSTSSILKDTLKSPKNKKVE